METLTLIADSGAVHDVTGRLIIDRDPNGLSSWQGEIYEGSGLDGLVGEMLTVRTEDGEGKALLTRWSSDGTGYLQGSGGAASLWSRLAYVA
jgi:hypothetical protein